jgi:hypothetical protein
MEDKKQVRHKKEAETENQMVKQKLKSFGKLSEK